MIGAEIELPCHFVHQVLAGGEVFAVAAQFEDVGVEVVWDIAQGVIRVVSHQTMEATLPA